MNLRRMLRQAAAAVVLAVGVSSAGANLVTFVVSGTLDSGFDTLHSGDAFALTYTVDTSVPGNLIFQSGQTTFVGFDNVPAASVQIGAWLASTTNGITRETDDPASDHYEMFSGAVVSPPIGGLGVFFFTLELFDSSGALIPDAMTPVTDLSSFDQNAFWVIFDNSAAFVHGTVSNVAVVSEPGTLLLVFPAMAFWLWRVAARRRGRVSG